MYWFYLYLDGVIVDALLIGLHLVFGYLTLPYVMRENYRRIGIHFSISGSTGYQAQSLSVFFLDPLLSWISALSNLLSLLLRVKNYLSSFTNPKEFRDIAFKVKTFQLTAEEVCLLDIKAKSLVTNAKVTNAQIEEFVQVMAGREIGISKVKLYALLKDNGLMTDEVA